MKQDVFVKWNCHLQCEYPVPSCVSLWIWWLYINFLFTKFCGITCLQSTQTQDRCKVHFCTFCHGYLFPTIGSGARGDPQTRRLWEKVDKRLQDLALQMPSAFCRGKPPGCTGSWPALHALNTQSGSFLWRCQQRKDGSFTIHPLEAKRTAFLPIRRKKLLPEAGGLVRQHARLRDAQTWGQPGLHGPTHWDWALENRAGINCKGL